ncbi:MAG: metal-sensitive transcriptional regulator [Actinomycetota bacterium]|nr:metal-sensitive transcriptional regulator [Actinomycetota bacterium]
MQLEETEVHDILTRLRRVEGQIRGIQGMLEEGRDCSDVITQFSASMRALEHAGYKYFAVTMAMCATNPEQAALEGYDPQRLEKLFMQLT